MGTPWPGIDGAHGDFGFGKRNVERTVEDEMILEFGDALNLEVSKFRTRGLKEG